jgi:6-phosphogluconolactonase
MGHAILKSFPSDDALAAAAALAWLDAQAAAQAAGRGFTVALSGGRVMRKFFAALASLAAARRTDFARVDFFWADERCVPPDDPESNFLLADEALFLSARISSETVHRVCGEAAPAQAALAATAAMRRIGGVAGEEMPVLDLVLLGMGEDGHVASLFPGSAATEADMTSVFLPVFDAPKPPPNRITLGHGPLAAARAVWVLAAGPGKQPALRNSLATEGTTPLARVIQRRALTTVFTDIGRHSDHAHGVLFGELQHVAGLG